MQRFYCEKHEVTHPEGECGVCRLVADNAARVGVLTTTVMKYAASCVEMERALIDLIQSQDRDGQAIQ